MSGANNSFHINIFADIPKLLLKVTWNENFTDIFYCTNMFVFSYIAHTTTFNNLL